MRQVAGARVASHPDRYGPVTRVVGQHDQVTAGLEFAVGQPPGPGLGVRDSDSGHTLKCPPGSPVLPGLKCPPGSPVLPGPGPAAYGRAAPTKVDAYQPVSIGIFSTSIPVCGASMM